MFDSGKSMIKTQVKFASDFHRDKKKQKGDEVVKQATTQDDEEDDKGLKHGHFYPIKKRVNSVYKKILEIKKF